MPKGWLTGLLAALGGAALLAAACAPAAEPKPADTNPGNTTKPSDTTTKPADTSKPADTTKPADTSKPAETAKPKASISGIPLDPNAKMGGTLLVSTTEEGPSTSPWEEAAGVAPSAVHPQTNSLIQHETWLVSGTDANLEGYWNLHPDLAASWEQSKDGLQWIFKLRPNVKWSDGVPFTCKDTKWSFDTIRTGEGLRRSPRGIHLASIKEIQCTDDLTMVMNLKSPKASLPNMLALPYNSVFPQHIYAKDTDKLRNDPYKVGTGPFKLKDWVPSEKYVFEKRKDYWDQPFPYLDGIELRIIASAAVVTAQRAGRIDFQGQYTGGQAETLNKECQSCQFFPKYIHQGFTTLMVNHQRPPWNTPEIKDALSLAIDDAKFVKVGAQGWGEPSRGGLFPSASPWALPYERVKQIPGYNFEDPAGSRAKATELLAKAGYKQGELVVPLTIWNTATVVASSVPLIEDLQAAGFKVEQKLLQTALAYDAMTAGDFTAHMHGFWVSDNDPDLMLYEHYYTGSDRNYGRYSKPEVDRLIDQMSQTIDPALRKQRVWDLQEILLKDHAKHILQWAAYQPIWSKRTNGILPGNNASWSYGTVRRHATTWLSEK